MGSPDLQIVWFKRDLRIRDHAPLVEAALRGPVVPLYIVEPELWAQPDSAGQHWEYVRESLVELREDLRALGAPLIVRTGEATAVLTALQNELAGGMAAVWCHEETGNDWTFQRDRRVLAWARTNRVQMHEFPHDGIVRRLTDRDDWGQQSAQVLRAPLLAAPSSLRTVDLVEGEIPTLKQLGFATDGPAGTHPAGSTAARATLDSFLQDRCVGYEKRLSSPVTAWDSCSRLSAHLTYGTISLREVMARTKAMSGREPTKRFSLKAFDERLHWRSHFIQKLEDQPSLEHRSYIEAFDEMRLDPETSTVGADRYHAWATGTTGYPMVDACMRSLNETGWINFRMRSMLVSFASYDLWIDWRWTARHLAQAFIDYEPGIHYPQVQMQSGTTGINTIRMYDPTKQGLDHDPDGSFVRRWVPELAGIPDASIHQPWLLSGTLFGGPSNYASPVVNHADAVAYAWKHIDKIKSAARRNGTAAAIQEQHGSRRPPPSSRRGGPRRRS